MQTDTDHAAERIHQDAYTALAGSQQPGDRTNLNLVKHLVGTGYDEITIFNHFRAQNFSPVEASRLASAAAHIITHPELRLQAAT